MTKTGGRSMKLRRYRRVNMQTILVCDDDKEIVEAIEIYLQQEGFSILKA